MRILAVLTFSRVFPERVGVRNSCIVIMYTRKKIRTTSVYASQFALGIWKTVNEWMAWYTEVRTCDLKISTLHENIFFFISVFFARARVGNIQAKIFSLRTRVGRHTYDVRVFVWLPWCLPNAFISSSKLFLVYHRQRRDRIVHKTDWLHGERFCVVPRDSATSVLWNI